MKLKAFFKGRRRCECAPFGKVWKFNNRYETVGIFICLAFILIFCGFFISLNEPMAFLSLFLPFLLILLICVYGLHDNIYSLIALGSRSEAEYELLCREYREFKEKNILRYGIITSYGIVSDDGMLPWNKITRIKVTPKERRYTHRGGIKTVPAKIRYYASISGKLGTSLSISLTEQYDLSDEIERFLDMVVKHTDPHCLIENEYYYEQ